MSEYREQVDVTKPPLTTTERIETAYQRGRYDAVCEAIRRVRRDARTTPLTPPQQEGIDRAITVLEDLGDEIFYKQAKDTTFGERHAATAGTAEGLPADLAAQHEHYRLGKPKR